MYRGVHYYSGMNEKLPTETELDILKAVRKAMEDYDEYLEEEQKSEQEEKDAFKYLTLAPDSDALNAAGLFKTPRKVYLGAELTQVDVEGLRSEIYYLREYIVQLSMFANIILQTKDFQDARLGRGVKKIAKRFTEKRGEKKRRDALVGVP